MKLMRAAAFGLLAATVGLAGCDDDDDPTGPDISAFAGTWTATEIRYTSNQDPNRQLEITNPLVGGGLTLDIEVDGDFTGTITIPGAGTFNLKGDVTLEGDNEADVDFDWTGSPFENAPQKPIEDFTATYVLQGNNLTFTRTDATFHFPGRPAPESSTVVITMVRAST